jgi:hypothetical protein
MVNLLIGICAQTYGNYVHAAAAITKSSTSVRGDAVETCAHTSLLMMYACLLSFADVLYSACTLCCVSIVQCILYTSV